MFDRCFRCGEPGHTRRQCPQSRTNPPAPDYVRPESWQPPPMNGPRHQYPEDHYMLYQCEWCGAPAYTPCVNTASGRLRTPHEARLIRVDTY